MNTALDQNRFYVYGLFDRGVPFYIGKGKDKRAFDHIGEARRGSNRPVHKKIRSMDHEPDVKILTEGLAEDDAYDLEELTIRTVGRRSDNSGPLLNLSEGGQGGTSGYVVVLTPEQVKKKNKALASPEVRAKISDSNTGKIVSQETRDKISKIHKGKTIPQEMRDRISKTKTGAPIKPKTPEQCAAISKRQLGRVISEKTRKRISESVKKHGGLTIEQSAKQKEAVLKKVTCPHCDKIGARSIMMRWHFENCRHKQGD